MDASLQWSDVAWLKGITRLPILLKGVMTGEDAAIAVDRGVAGIIVSNHGARQLDSVNATLHALPEIVAAVGGRAEVFLDGGVRTGADAFKVLHAARHSALRRCHMTLHTPCPARTCSVPPFQPCAAGTRPWRPCRVRGSPHAVGAGA